MSTAPTLDAAMAALREIYPGLDDRDAAQNGEAAVTCYVSVPSTSQVSAVANTLLRLDLLVRRVTAVFEFGATSDYYRPTSPESSGLLLDAISVGSYHGRHRLQGTSEYWANRHPWYFAIMFGVLNLAGSVYIAPVAPGTYEQTVPPVPADREQTVQIDVEEIRELLEIQPPTSGGGGTVGEVTIVIEGPGGSYSVRFESRPGAPRQPRR